MVVEGASDVAGFNEVRESTGFSRFHFTHVFP